jgi:hypothetical protein
LFKLPANHPYSSPESNIAQRNNAYLGRSDIEERRRRYEGGWN